MSRIWSIAARGGLLIALLLVGARTSAPDAQAQASSATPSREPNQRFAQQIPLVAETPTVDGTLVDLQREKLRAELTKIRLDADPTLAALQQTKVHAEIEKIRAESTKIHDDLEPTRSALQQAKLADEVFRGTAGWTLFSNASASAIAVIVAVLGPLIAAWVGLSQFNKGQVAAAELRRTQEEQDRDRRETEAEAERLRRSEQTIEERFKSVVQGLGATEEAAQVSAAALLRLFAQEGADYAAFRIPIFDLAAAHLRSQPAPPTPFAPPEPLTRELGRALKEAYPLARAWVDQRYPGRLLDASSVRLQQAHFVSTDLERLWLPGSTLTGADLTKAKLNGANLSGSDVRGATMRETELTGADLSEVEGSATENAARQSRVLNLAGATMQNASLVRAQMRGAALTEATLTGADLSFAVLESATLINARLQNAKLAGTILTSANLLGADLSGCSLVGAQLDRASLSGAILVEADLRGANLRDALSLAGAHLYNVLNVSQEVLEECSKRGAIVDRPPAR